MKEYNVEQDVPTLWCVNLSINNILKSTIQYSGTIHNEKKLHSFRNLVNENRVTIECVGAKELLVNILSKVLDTKQFKKLKGKPGICVKRKLLQLIYGRRVLYHSLLHVNLGQISLTCPKLSALHNNHHVIIIALSLPKFKYILLFASLSHLNRFTSSSTLINFTKSPWLVNQPLLYPNKLLFLNRKRPAPLLPS